MITEIDICRGIAEGALPSPTPWQNSTYVALRLSGTGVAYRPSGYGSRRHRRAPRAYVGDDNNWAIDEYKGAAYVFRVMIAALHEETETE